MRFWKIIFGLAAGFNFLVGLPLLLAPRAFYAAAGQPLPPTFRDALETQYVCDAVLKSAKTKKWEKVKAVAKAKARAKK